MNKPKPKRQTSYCPCCGRKTIVKINHVESCTNPKCRLERILLPGQDF